MDVCVLEKEIYYFFYFSLVGCKGVCSIVLLCTDVHWVMRRQRCFYFLLSLIFGIVLSLFVGGDEEGKERETLLICLIFVLCLFREIEEKTIILLNLIFYIFITF